MCLSVFFLRLLGNIASKFAIKMAVRAAALAYQPHFFPPLSSIVAQTGMKGSSKKGNKGDTWLLVYYCFKVIRCLKLTVYA